MDLNRSLLSELDSDISGSVLVVLITQMDYLPQLQLHQVDAAIAAWYDAAIAAWCSILVCFLYKGNSYGVRLFQDSNLYYVRNLICSKWCNLSPLSFDLSFVQDDIKRLLISDYDLQALLCHSIINHVDSILINVDVISVGVSNRSTSVSSNCVDETISEKDCTVESGDLLNVLRMDRDSSVEVFTGVGQTFNGVVEFRNKLILYQLVNGYKLKFVKNDKQRVTAKCSNSSCNFRIHGSCPLGETNLFIVKTMRDNHSCGAGVFDVNHPPISSKFVKELVIGYIRSNPSMKTRDVILQCNSEFKVVLSYYYAYKGKALAIREIHGTYDLSYHHLVAYINSVNSTNPGSTTVLEGHPLTRRFERVFIGLDACARGFQYCRPIIFIDATFMKGKSVGCLMSAVGKNGNEGMFVLAFAIVSCENTDNWLWFLNNLREMLVADSRTFVFISDRHSGILHSVPRVFPNSYHSYCLYHLKQNLIVMLGKCLSKRGFILRLFSECAYAPTFSGFNKAIGIFRSVGGKVAARFLLNLPPEHYSAALFPGDRYGEMASNVAESFNSWILQERSLPVTSCLDAIRTKIMVLMSNRREESKDLNSILCPKAEKRIKTSFHVSAGWVVKKSSEYVFEVQTRRTKVEVVDLLSRICSCNYWRIYNFPCDHAIRVMFSQNFSVYDYVEDYFKTSYYQAAYYHPINPIPSSENVNDVPNDILLYPPEYKRLPGRPSTCRKMNAVEKVLKRKRHCGICKEEGHNKKTCKKTNV